MTTARATVQLPLPDVPFSHRGSWFSVSPLIAEGTCHDDLHLTSHRAGPRPLLRLVPTLGGVRAVSAVSATPTLLTWTVETGGDAAYVEMTYEAADVIRLRGHRVGLSIFGADPVLTFGSGVYLYRDLVTTAHVFSSPGTGRRYRVSVVVGSPPVAAGTQLLGTVERGLSWSEDAGPWEIAIEEFDSARAPYTSSETFDEIVDRTTAEFASFLNAVAPWRSPQTPAAELAVYVLWSATVRPAGFLQRPTVLMSKHWMDKVWSWDHCFNAIALAGGDPQLAWAQFQVLFDHQDEAGALPDSVAHSELRYDYVKPPIHGWALRALRAALPHALGRNELSETYHRLERWTEFWLTTRRVPGGDLPHYQHGNDSGWDNATTFDPERVVESADLAAFLVVQSSVLSDLALELDNEKAAARWSRTAAGLRNAMIDNLWDGEQFVTRSAETGQVWTSSSLLDLMPAVLGPDLPGEVLTVLVRRIKAHQTEFGLATERPDSPHYEDDGYWRGPIWAPSTLLLEDGLRRAGQTKLADEISEGFRRLCEVSGFAENFDARTGEGRRDRAHTWTASVYLILACAYENRIAAGESMPELGAETTSATRTLSP